VTGADELEDPALAGELDAEPVVLPEPDDDELTVAAPLVVALEPVVLDAPVWVAMTPTSPAKAAAERPIVTRRARAAGWRRRGPGLRPARGERRPLGALEGRGEGVIGSSSGRSLDMGPVSGPDVRPGRGAP
jgi:hypothetical protein